MSVTYQSAVSDIYPAKGNPPLRQEQQHYIAEMEREGCTVILEDAGNQFVVKVRQPGHRQIRSGSTSGYPIDHAFGTWKAQTTPIGIVRFHLHNGTEVPCELLLPTGRLAESGRQIIGFKHRAGGEWTDITAPGHGIVDLVGLIEIYLVTGNPISASTILPRVRIIEAVKS